MRDKLDKLLESFSDVYAKPDQNRVLELQSALGDLEFDGIHIGAPEKVDPSIIGIPTITLVGTQMRRRGEVSERENAAIVAINLDLPDMRIPPLYQRPTKRLKPMPKAPKSGDLAADARSWGAHYRVIGEDGDLMPGTYSMSIIEWDRVSNIITVVKQPKPDAAPIKLPVQQWPWELWKTQAADFQAQAGSPKVDDTVGLSVKQVGADKKAVLLGSFCTKARPIHVIVSDSGILAAKPGIRAGVPIDLMQFTLDRTSPEHTQVLVPIQASAPVKPGDPIAGWFSFPLANLQREQETMVYAFVDGFRAGPFRIPALKP